MTSFNNAPQHVYAMGRGRAGISVSASGGMRRIYCQMIGNASTPKCIKYGCDRDQASGSKYCYRRKYSLGSSLQMV
jgi:hypothetical protein